MTLSPDKNSHSTKPAPQFPKSEWPTWLIIFIAYGGWWFTLSVSSSLPAFVLIPILAVLLTLHSSLNHEVIHGHPTRSTWLNDALAYPPLALVYPYTLFKVSHLQHHHDPDITYPGIDPESFFVSEEKWQTFSSLNKRFARINMTLSGRLILFPAYAVLTLSREALISILQWRKDASMWLIHIAFVCGILFLVTHYFDAKLWHYLLASYLSQSLILLRSFFEHQPSKNIPERIVLQEAGWFFRLLFLNNNYHLVHHTHPGLPWFSIPGEYRRHLDYYRKQNNGFRFNGYKDWLKYLFKPIHSPKHPWK